MTKKQKEKVLQGLRKKDNMAYWDEIDETVLDFLKTLNDYSYPRVQLYYEEEEEGWEEEYDAEDLEFTDEFMEAAAAIRNFAIKYLEKHFKAWFPYVDESC